MALAVEIGIEPQEDSILLPNHRSVDRVYLEGLIDTVADAKGLKPFLEDTVLKEGLFDGITQLLLPRRELVRLLNNPVVQARVVADSRGSRKPFVSKYLIGLIDVGLMVGEMDGRFLVYSQDDVFADLSIYYAYWMERFAAITKNDMTGIYEKTRESVVEMLGPSHPMSDKILAYQKQSKDSFLDFNAERNKLSGVDREEIVSIKKALRNAIRSDAITAYDSVSMARLMQKTGGKEWFVYEAVFKIGQFIKSIQDTKSAPLTDTGSINYSEYLDYLGFLENQLLVEGQDMGVILRRLENRYEDVVKIRQQINQPDISNIKDYKED